MRIVIILLSMSIQTALAANNDEAIALTDEQMRSLGIATSRIEASSETFSPNYPAQVVIPNAQIRIVGANIDGLISKMVVATGQEISKGEDLCTISSRELLSQQQDYLEIIIELNQATLTLNRDKELYDEGIIPQRRYQQSRTRWKILNSQKQQLNALLRFSGMTSDEIIQLEKSQTLKGDITLVAPMDGILVEQIAIAGQKVQVTDPLFKLANLSSLWLEVHVPLAVTQTLRIGDTVFTSESDIQAKIITIGKQIHRADQGTFIRAEVHNNAESLRPGQFVQVHLAKKIPSGQKYAIPPKAIIRIDKETLIFVATPNGFKPHNIKMIGYLNDKQIVSSEEKITDPIVVKGASSLKAMLLNEGG